MQLEKIEIIREADRVYVRGSLTKQGETYSAQFPLVGDVEWDAENLSTNERCACFFKEPDHLSVFVYCNNLEEAVERLWGMRDGTLDRLEAEGKIDIELELAIIRLCFTPAKYMTPEELEAIETRLARNVIKAADVQKLIDSVRSLSGVEKSQQSHASEPALDDADPQKQEGEKSHPIGESEMTESTEENLADDKSRKKAKAK